MTDAAAAFTFAIAPICLQGGHGARRARGSLGHRKVGTTNGECGRCQMRQAALHCGQSQHNLLELPTFRLNNSAPFDGEADLPAVILITNRQHRERYAAAIADFSQKQQSLNTVCEKSFQGFCVKVADTHGLVYEPFEVF